MTINETLTKELSLQLWQVENTVNLIAEGATIPFIARYRKEVTGSLDDDTLRELSTRLSYLQNLEKRKDEVIGSIDEQGKLTGELEAAIRAGVTLAEVEDLYRPYKQKRKTRASVARERGLAPLAETLLEQKREMPDPLTLAAQYVDEEKGVPDPQAALDGAKDIVAETLSDSAEVRKILRELLARGCEVKTAAAKDEDNVYSMYADYREPFAKIPPHRILAINRGEREGFLKVGLEIDAPACMGVIYDQFLKGKSPAREVLVEALDDGFSRLLFPSLENELRGMLSEKAADSAIDVFKANLEQLLMQPPLKDRVVLGVDPAYRTGCKIAVVDHTGKVLDVTVIYPTPPQNKVDEAKRTLKALIKKHGVNVISIGNGTASAESERFVAELIGELPELKLSYMVVSEAGASVYSASKLAAEEFPEFDVSLRSAVSIARRIQDPLAELVKIDPKAIGVGQYQHDMPPAKLDDSLGGVVEDCVNSVGVDLNTASHSLLSYVSGVNKTVAKNIVAFREENGPFSGRSGLLKVPKLGKKAFEQCAGFLRVKGGENQLDNTAVHPESYKAAKAVLKSCGFVLADLDKGGVHGLREKARELGIGPLAKEVGVGEPTLKDIIDELLKPGRDPRDELPPPILRQDVMSMEDLEAEMILTGTVRNITDFGAFVDIGVHQDGLVHISRLSERFVKHPLDAVKVGQIVKVKVVDVYLNKKRISLAIKGVPQDG
ncbi:MAG: RNA-binding transcriptional accessory protein [Oscillospiraceae bacterium]|nr:RNA-binding transcriptional accessory protein [Oscillospiraceae bacterium]